MRGQTFLLLLTGLTLLFSLSALTEDTNGRTADGCTYKVINGQYLTSCPKRGEALAARDSVHTVAAAPQPVTNYDSIPVHHNYAAAAPQLPPQQPSVSYGVSSIERDNGVASDYDARDDIKRERLHAKLVDQTYVGLQIGASNVKESNAGSATGFGLEIGTNVDDTFGFEFGYSYSKQNLNLNLSSRDSNDPFASSALATSDGSVNSTSSIVNSQGSTNGTVAATGSDSTLSTNLFRGEVLAHLTDSVKRLRPYVGAGLGWRTATLQENSSSSIYGSSLAGGSLHQNVLGGIASAGTKLRIAKSVSLSFAFDYYLPISRASARLEQPVTAMNETASSSRLTSSDSILTGSSQYQILGGVQYAF
jgi:hypothetical protein